MTPSERQPEGNEGMEAGMLDYQARKAVRELIDRYGFEHARMMLAFFIMDEADKPVRRASQ